MARNPFNHVDLRVADLDAALPFYHKLMPALGFTYEGSYNTRGVIWETFTIMNAAPNQFFAITEDKGHVPNRNCIAFFVESREEVDQVAKVAKKAGGQNIEEPSECPEYGATYYAVFLEDPSGNRLEAVNWKL